MDLIEENNDISVNIVYIIILVTKGGYLDHIKHKATKYYLGGNGFIRISYAYSIDNLKIALNRISEFINELKK